MNFLSKLLTGISFVPVIVTGVEGLFGHKSGADKKKHGADAGAKRHSSDRRHCRQRHPGPEQIPGRSGQGDRWRGAVPEFVGVVKDEIGMKEPLLRPPVEGRRSNAVW